MADPFAVLPPPQVQSSSADPWANYGFEHKKKHRHGLLGFVENVGSDLGGLGKGLVGIPAGLAHVGHGIASDLGEEAASLTSGRSREYHSRTLDLLRGIEKQYKDYYGHDLKHHLYEPPLQPVLDVLTVASGGSGAAAKLGLLSKERALLELRSPAALAGQEGPIARRLSSEKPLVRAREQATSALLNKVKVSKGDVHIDLEASRYGKTIRAKGQRVALAETPAYTRYGQALSKLSKRLPVAQRVPRLLQGDEPEEAEPETPKVYTRMVVNGKELGAPPPHPLGY